MGVLLQVAGTDKVYPTGTYFGPGKVVVCGRHLRRPLQPITNHDREKGYGKGTCPFCKGGLRYRQFHKYRSTKRWWRELQLCAAEIYMEENPVEINWDSYEGFSKDQVATLVGTKNGREVVDEELWEYNVDYIWEQEKYIHKQAIEELDLPFTWEELRDEGVYPIIGFDLERMARYTNAYLAIQLPPEHIYGWEDYEDVEDELEFFGINPADLAEYFPEIEWPDIQGRTPLISVRGIVEGWVNFFYGGYWHVMLDAQETLRLLIRGELDLSAKMTLKKGANIILHDYWNGSSSINTQTLADIQVDTGELYNDGGNRYGIQACCGMVDEAWNGVLECVH